MVTLAELSQHAWLTATDDFSFAAGEQGPAEVGFKVGFTAALQLVGQAQRDESDRMTPIIAEALEVRERTSEAGS